MYAVTFPIKSLVGSLRAIIPRKFVLPADIESFTNRRRRRSQNIRKNSKYKWELVLLKARGVLDCVAVALSVTQPQTVENALKLFNWRYLTAAFTKNHWTDRTAEINNVPDSQIIYATLSTKPIKQQPFCLTKKSGRDTTSCTIEPNY